MVETEAISTARSLKRVSDIEQSIAKGENTKDQVLTGLLCFISDDLQVARGDLLQDLHTYGVLRDKWKGEIDLIKYDAILIDMVSHPENAMSYKPK